MDELNLVCNPDEVQAISWIPIRTFIETGTVETVRWTGGTYSRISFNCVDPETGRKFNLSGATAFICTNISAIALNQDPSIGCTGNYNVFGVPCRNSDTVTVTLRPIALTSKDIEQWKACGPTRPTVPVGRWLDTIAITSKS